jgi:hypothetical protein
MAKKASGVKPFGGASVPASRLKSSSLLDTPVVYCGDNLEQLAKPVALLDALRKIESFFKRSHKVIVALTVQEILDEHIAKKLV